MNFICQKCEKSISLYGSYHKLLIEDYCKCFMMFNQYVLFDSLKNIISFQIYQNDYVLYSNTHINNYETELFKLNDCNSEYGIKTMLYLNKFFPINNQEDFDKLLKRLITLIPFS